MPALRSIRSTLDREHDQRIANSFGEMNTDLMLVMDFFLLMPASGEHRAFQLGTG